jgi:hypothetical protein
MAEEKSKPYIKNDDFLIENELTVTITLSEYRSLVGFEAKHGAEMDKLKREKYEVEKENKRLKDKILSLTTECEAEEKEEEEW